MSQSDLARRLSERMNTNFDRSKVNKILKDQREISAEEMLSIEEITNFPAPATLRTMPPVESLAGGEPNDRLKAARERAGFDTARQAAIRFGWTISAYTSHEDGETPMPQEAAEKYAAKFKTSVEWILTGEGSPEYDQDEADIIKLFRQADPAAQADAMMVLQNSKKPAERAEPQPSSRHRPPANRK